jgi:opacity protein-like surface antigen
MNQVQTTALLLLAAFSLPAASQTTDSHSLTEDSRALQFQISSNFTLSPFQGATLSYKHHLQPSSALRIGLDLSFNDEGSDGAQQNFNNDTLSSTDNTTLDQSSFVIRLNTQAIWYSETSSEISFFYGTGPFLGYSRYRQNDERIFSPVGSSQSKSSSEGKGTTWSVGLTGLAGVEWFVSQSISLHGEYGLSLGYFWSKGESTFSTTGNRSSSEGTTTSRQLSSNGVRFGLSVYF